MAVDSSGNVYVSTGWSTIQFDAGNPGIKKYTPDGLVSLFVGGITAAIGGSSDGVGSGAYFNSPQGMYIVPGQPLMYIAENGASAIRYAWLT
jgi:hypothetical protein